jgi:hypothetical protein
MTERATKREIHYFDDKLWVEVYEHNEKHTIMGSLSNIAAHMRNKFPNDFPNCDRYEVDRALERLENADRIERWLDGKNYYTMAKQQLFQSSDDNSFFIDENPIPLSKTAVNIYNFMVDNRYIGKAHRIAMKALAKKFEIDERSVRKIIERINNDGYVFPEGMQPFEFIIMGNTDLEGGYYIVSNDNEFRAYCRRYDFIVFKASRKARTGRKKWGNDEQFQAKLESIEKEIKFFYDHNYSGEVRVEKHMANEIAKLPFHQEVDQDNIKNKEEKIIYYYDDGTPIPF